MIVSFLMLSCCLPAAAETEDLQQFLHSVEEAAQVTVPLRGDGKFEVTSPDGARQDDIAVIIRPPADTYIELHQQGIKVLLPGKEGKAFRFNSGASTAAEFPIDASFADSDFVCADLQPFRVSDYKEARISDDSATELVVTLFPATSRYSLLVITFDRQKKVPLKTLYYRETLNNLVKMRRDGDYVLVGRKWMPGTTSMEAFKQRTRTDLHLRWTQDAVFPPELFDPVFLARPAVSLWPAATP